MARWCDIHRIVDELTLADLNDALDKLGIPRDEKIGRSRLALRRFIANNMAWHDEATWIPPGGLNEVPLEETDTATQLREVLEREASLVQQLDEALERETKANQLVERLTGDLTQLDGELAMSNAIREEQAHQLEQALATLEETQAGIERSQELARRHRQELPIRAPAAENAANRQILGSPPPRPGTLRPPPPRPRR